MELSYLISIGLTGVFGFSIFYIFYLFSQPNQELENKIKKSNENVKKDDKKSKDKKDKINKKATKKNKEDTQSIIKDQVETKIKNGTVKNESLADVTKTPNSINAQKNSTENSVKTKVVDKQQKVNEKSTESKNIVEKQKKNQSPVIEKVEEKKIKTTPKQSKKNNELEDDFITEKLNTSSQINLENDVSFIKLVELIKTVPLSNEEIQVIIDSLLSKNTDGSSDWINKNDPITVLKKQLEEKELELKNETENHERAKARIGVMRDEINVEKQKYLSYKEQTASLTLKLQNLELKLHKFEEIKQDEFNRLQLSISTLQKKLNEDRNLAVLKLQEEQGRTQNVVNQLESEKAKQNVLSFQIIKLENERKQFDSLNSNLKNLNEGLQKENQSLKEHINQLENDLKNKEYSFQKQMNEKDENCKNILNKIEEKSKELNSNAVSANQLQMKLDELNNENQKNVNERLVLNQYVKKLKDERRSLIQILEKVSAVKNEDDVLQEVNRLVSDLQSISDQKNKINEENKKFKESLQEEKTKNFELDKKIKHFENTLVKAEKDLSLIGATADEEFKNWNQRVKQTEKDYYEIAQEHEKLVSEMKEIKKNVDQKVERKIEINA